MPENGSTVGAALGLVVGTVVGTGVGTGGVVGGARTLFGCTRAFAGADGAGADGPAADGAADGAVDSAGATTWSALAAVAGGALTLLAGGEASPRVDVAGRVAVAVVSSRSDT